MDQNTQIPQTSEKMSTNNPKKSFWTMVSPKMMLVSGIVIGIAVFAVLNVLYSYLSLIKTNGSAVVNNQPAVNNEPAQDGQLPAGTQVGSFTDTGKPICEKNGKPIIRLFSTTWCPHCQWIQDTFDKVAKEYIQAGKIIAYHWQLDTGDDTLTSTIEKTTPPEEEAIYQEFNPQGSIPTFVFGCRYYRVGNAYEQQGDAGKPKEETEFRQLIDKIISEE